MIVDYIFWGVFVSSVVGLIIFFLVNDYRGAREANNK